ncbi:MAG: hypothetical protein ACRD63_00950, partial [Pyrinomonadaceae bacterium]
PCHVSVVYGCSAIATHTATTRHAAAFARETRIEDQACVSCPINLWQKEVADDLNIAAVELPVWPPSLGGKGDVRYAPISGVLVRSGNR